MALVDCRVAIQTHVSDLLQSTKSCMLIMNRFVALRLKLDHPIGTHPPHFFTVQHEHGGCPLTQHHIGIVSHVVIIMPLPVESDQRGENPRISRVSSIGFLVDTTLHSGLEVQSVR